MELETGMETRLGLHSSCVTKRMPFSIPHLAPNEHAGGAGKDIHAEGNSRDVLSMCETKDASGKKCCS